MTSITKQTVGKYTYLYESKSYWNQKKKRPENKKTIIAKLDPLTNQPHYTQQYLNQLTQTGQPTTGLKLWDKTQEKTINTTNIYRTDTQATQAILDKTQDFGPTYFLEQLSQKIGLHPILQQTLPQTWQEIFCLASYLITTNKPLMYCQDWIETNAGLNTNTPLTSQHISELLASFGPQQRNNFYRTWHQHIQEQQYIALDLTALSTYSQQIQAAEWGYNRDDENLPQINLCLLYGQTSKLPVYQTLYSGSLKDVSTLRSTLQEFDALTNQAPLMLTLDRGYYSSKNIHLFLTQDQNGNSKYRFLLSVPFTTQFAKDQVVLERESIDRLENVVLTSGAPIRGVHRHRVWEKGVELEVHVFFNPEKALQVRNELFGYVTWLARQAAVKPDDAKLALEYKKYLLIHKSVQGEGGVVVEVCGGVVEAELAMCGWFVLLSNHIVDVQEAYDVYRLGDVVEKGFLRYKSNLGLDRVRVHGDLRMENKLFVAFVALILTAAICEGMRKHDLFGSLTFERLFLVLAKLKCVCLNGQTILRPLTREQVSIFEAFGIALPDYDTRKPVVPKKRGRKPKQPAPETLLELLHHDLSNTNLG